MVDKLINKNKKDRNKNKKDRSPYAKYTKDGNIILDDTAITPEWYIKYFESENGIDEV